MEALWIILGIAIGTGGYYLYDKFFNKVEQAVVSEAQNVGSLAKKVRSDL